MLKAELKPRSLHWFALALLVISICINYADRGNLGVAAKSLERELHLGQGELGTLLGAFSITYAVSQLFAGKLEARSRTGRLVGRHDDQLVLLARHVLHDWRRQPHLADPLVPGRPQASG